MKLLPIPSSLISRIAFDGVDCSSARVDDKQVASSAKAKYSFMHPSDLIMLSVLNFSSQLSGFGLTGFLPDLDAAEVGCAAA